ncbi:MAG: YgeY family selenium metabolism-linked hydrolase [Candidatus Heimdallarchaeota archaeon]|nr:YgeY family selenium metabolism-linked hydrolase [Candidatus Heimdallarchaeota archaeon]
MGFSMNKKITKLIKQHEKDIVQLTQELVQTSSVTGEEEMIIKKLKEKFKDFGFDEIIIDSMGNLIGRIGSGKKILAIDGHVDTVEIGDHNLWNFDPLGGKIHNKKIWGRGSCDQKGGLASALYAIKLLEEIGVPENLTVYMVASIQEETFEGMNWQYILEEDKIKPQAVILTEPSNLRISLGHRGRMDIKIQTEGVSSHGANPNEGINAIYKMYPILAEIEEMHEQLPEDPVFGKATIAVTDIKSTSVSLNAIAYSCTIHLDRRLGINDTKESVLKELKELPSVLEAEAQVFLPDYEVKTYCNHSSKVKGYYPAWKMDENELFVKIATKAFEETFNEKSDFIHWKFSTNGVATKGYHNIPTIGFGPGDERFAHTYEEHIPIDHLLKATQFYIFCLLLFAEEYEG